MAKTRLNQDDAFKSIMGHTSNSINENEADQAKDITVSTKPTSFYITDKHRKALKIKTAFADKPEDKDMSSIVRAALDVYLADILRDL